MAYGWLNIGSIMLGLISWLLPIASLVQRNKAEYKRWPIFTAASMGACAVAIFFQVLYNAYLVRKEDWSALMDTSNAVVLASSVLLAVTVALNIIALIICRKNAVRQR